MKKFILLCLFIIDISIAQEFYIGNAILYSIAAGYTEALQFKENHIIKDPAERRKINSLWHKTQLLERGLGISLGITIGEYSKLNWKKMVSSLFLSGAIFWNVYDGTMNLTINRSFYAGSKTTPDIFERYRHFKIPVLAIAILINFLIEYKIL